MNIFVVQESHYSFNDCLCSILNCFASDRHRSGGTRMYTRNHAERKKLCRGIGRAVLGFAFIFVSVFPGNMVMAGSENIEIRDIHFPVEGTVTYDDNYGEPRWEHAHEGIDIRGEKMQKLLAAVDGYVSYLVDPEASWGYAIVVRDAEGYTYHYLHVNNDTPGTDDGKGGFFNAYASGMYEGARVVRGQHIAWMGDSGNAEVAGAHLHFEIRKDGTPINPYPSLVRAQSPLENGSQTGQAGGGGGLGSGSGTGGGDAGTSFDPDAAKAASPTINADKNLSSTPGVSLCEPGALIKSSSSTAVYYCGADGRRYVFPHKKVYKSWYDDFTEVAVITEINLAQIRLGGNVTYRPGVKLIKIQTDPKVYTVAPGGVLRWITSPQIAASLYGTAWAKQVDDVSDAFFVNYTVGEPVSAAQ